MYEVSRGGSSSRAFSVEIGRDEMFGYLIHTSFSGWKGVLRISISAACLVLAVLTRGMFDIWFTIFLTAIGLLNPVITPVLFLLRAAPLERQKPKYTFCFEAGGITVSLDGKKKTLAWDAVFCAEITSKLIIVSEAAASAFIVPRRQIPAGREEEIINLTLTSLPANKIKGRFRQTA